jgi:tetratricopeptide (TPR) repeat protein
MSALQTPEKSSRRKELRENKIVELYARALLLWDEHRSAVLTGFGVLVAAILAIPGYMYYQQQQQEEANQLLGQILPVYEQGNYQQALDGTGDARGLKEIADDFGGTSAGNLATYYAAHAYYQTDQYDRALTYFQRYDKEKDFFGASAYAAQAAIHESRGDFDRAGERYEQAASHFESDLTTPRYLLRAGQAYEQAGAFDAAAQAYRQITEEYPDAQQVQDAEVYLARVQAKQQAKQRSSAS